MVILYSLLFIVIIFGLLSIVYVYNYNLLYKFHRMEYNTYSQFDFS